MFQNVLRANARLLSTRPTSPVLGLVHTARFGAARQLAPGRFLQQTAVKSVSDEAKAKVEARKLAMKNSSSIEDRVKKIICDRLGVKFDEVRDQANKSCRYTAVHIFVRSRSLLPRVLSRILEQTAWILSR